MQRIGTWSVERVCYLAELIVEARENRRDVPETIRKYYSGLSLPFDKKAILSAIKYADAIESYQPKQREANYA